MVVFCSQSNHASTEINYLNVVYSSGSVKLLKNLSGPFQIDTHKYYIPDESRIITQSDGELIANKEDWLQIRLKPETSVLLSNISSAYIDRGTAGIRVSNNDYSLSSSHLQIKSIDGIIVVKVNPILTRVCIIRGTAVVKHQKTGKSKTLKADMEIAASQLYLSDKYHRTDEMRFVWYWVSPDKEPAFN